jgi:hypothetical protein
MALRQAIWDAFKAFPTWSRSAPVCQACAHRLRTWPMERYDHEAIRTGTKEPSEISFELTRDVLVESALTGCPLCTIAMHTLRLHGTVNSLTIRYQLLNTNPQIDPGNLDLFRVWETWSETDTDPDGQQQQQEHQSIYDFWMYAHAGLCTRKLDAVRKLLLTKHRKLQKTLRPRCSRLGQSTLPWLRLQHFNGLVGGLMNVVGRIQTVRNSRCLRCLRESSTSGPRRRRRIRGSS